MIIHKYSTGVYMIRNIVNMKCYIGSSATSLLGRIRHHKTLLKNGYHKNSHLQAAWNKYGSKSFVFFILKRCSPEECLDWEQYWIDHYESCYPENGYNSAPIAGNSLGCKRSDELKARLSAWMKQPEVVARLTASRRTPEYSKKLSLIHKGRKKSEEHKKKLSDAGMGKKMSPENLAKLVEINRNRIYGPVSEETRKKMSESAKRRTDACSLSHSIRMRGRKASTETRNKMALSQKLAWAKRKGVV